MQSNDVVLVDIEERVGTVTLNRPEARNALSSEVLAALPEAMAQLEADDGVDVIVLTGTDPAFCAGLDLKELGSTGGNLGSGNPTGNGFRRGAWGPTTKPVIGAVNGVAVTGGFELALQCDFLIASERAAFADTHARVGVMPGWGLSVLLPEAIGVRRAREMSITGNYLGADEAHRLGLVNHVVAHDDLMGTVRRIAADTISNDQSGVRQMLATYAATAATTIEDAWQVEADMAKHWRGDGYETAEIESRRAGIVERGRGQIT